MSNVSDLPAFPPPGFTKEKAEKLLKMVEEAKADLDLLFSGGEE